MAYAWEDADGVPKDVADIIKTEFDATLEPIFIIPEFKVALKGGQRESQNDVFLWARIGEKTAAIMVEGKVNESFGPLIGEWFKNPTQGKKTRLEFLCQQLGAVFPPPNHLRYQLFHRTVSAILTARRCKADMAIMLVQSFSQDHIWWEDFEAFADYLNITPERGQLSQTALTLDMPTYIGWVTGHPKYLSK